MLAVRFGAVCATALALVSLGSTTSVSGQQTALPPVQPSLTVSSTQGLDPDGETVTVTGAGYDEARGIYVAFCVVPPPGQTPTPCGGGADLSGEGGASRWISSNPPDYGVGLAEPYGPGGTFTVQITVNAQLSEQIDCRQVQCAVVTRSDHTRLSDRSLDVIVPVFFDAGPPPSAAPSTPSTVPAPAPTAQSPGPAVTDPPTGNAPSTPATEPITPQSSTTIAVVPIGGDPPVTLSATGAPDATAPEPRGAAPLWPVWVGTAGVAAGLAALAPRHRKQRS